MLLVAGLLVLSGGVFVQEGNPLPVLWGILRLEFSRGDVVRISPQWDGMLMIRAGQGLSPLTEHLGDHGWQLEEQLGSMAFYAAGDNRLSVHLRMFTRWYVICDLDLHRE